ncbi:uncharacterized protein LOC111718081 isoform X2 [Eurytemora carolleeae]|uniref:uncharacterized protein LOC111718081 isoform X2 n=1 Tax=Eurytemora carolleeae TaxID=1294199 RepID=UPI000C78D0B5|nr:uncharacterized protein LOC111718081 isoform X2 [Eurytemora carolleeae]|eukprot:XP_023349345.1 uncharacterized protein LOC111718081 isoform X2 [Eurytemora affinis]
MVWWTVHEEGPTEPFGNHADIDPDEVDEAYENVILCDSIIAGEYFLVKTNNYREFLKHMDSSFFGTCFLPIVNTTLQMEKTGEARWKYIQAFKGVTTTEFLEFEFELGLHTKFMCPVLKKPMDILVTARGKNKFIALSSVDNPGSGVRTLVDERTFNENGMSQKLRIKELPDFVCNMEWARVQKPIII